MTVAGINAAAAISVANGQYSVNGGAYTAAAGTVNNGDTVTVQHTSASTNSASVTTTLTIGGVNGTFTSTTLSAGLPGGGGSNSADGLMLGLLGLVALGRLRRRR